jgi:hypothetical protein
VKGKDICASFAVITETTKVTATMPGKYLVTMEKTVNMSSIHRRKQYIQDLVSF